MAGEAPVTGGDLAALVDASTARWPALRIDPAALAAALTDRALAATAPTAPDVALALALAAGDPTALAIFEREVVPDLRGALARLDDSGDAADEALQRTREKLLVGGPGAARIAEYRGRGRLAAWVQVIAIREALLLRRANRRDAPAPAHVLDDRVLAAVTADPALALAKATHRAALADVFRAALAALEPRDRALLRLAFANGAGTEQLAALYRVHRVTMYRWLADARARLLDHVRVGVAERIGISASEVDSLILAIASSLDIGW